MNFDPADPAFNSLRVTQHEAELADLMVQFPMLSRTEISDVIKRVGPMRTSVEVELDRISRGKR